MKKTILIPILLCATTLFAQNQPDNVLLKETTEIQKSFEKQKKEIEKLNSILENQINTTDALKQKVSHLKSLIDTNKNNITLIANDLGTKIQQTETTARESVSNLDKDVEKNRLYWIIGTLIILMLGGLIYWLLGKRIALNQTDVESQIRSTKKTLEEESLKLDSKLVEFLDTQLKLNQEEKQIVSANSNTEIDHSLALKVADEIVRMQKNISKMDEETKGLKPLVKGIERIQANFASNGYEMVNLLNKDYDERMNIDVINFITDENLTAGRKIITSVIKPQVNFNGVLIQRAQVDVSQN